jgi:hypothetical protein
LHARSAPLEANQALAWKLVQKNGHLQHFFIKIDDVTEMDRSGGRCGSRMPAPSAGFVWFSGDGGRLVMKAVLFDEHGGVDKLVYRECPDPVARTTDVIVRVRAAGLNYLDIFARRGMPNVTVPLP